GKKVMGDQTADLQYLGTHKNNGWRTNVHARLGSRDVHDRLGRRRSLRDRRKCCKRVSSSSSDSSDNEDEETGHWKSRKGYRNQEDEDMSHPWRRQKVDAFTRRISDFSKDKRRRMPANVKTYDGTGDPDDHLKIFESAATIKNWPQHVCSGYTPSSARLSTSKSKPLFRRGAGGGSVGSVSGTVWWGVVKGAHYRSAALVVVVMAWVVPRSGPIIVKTELVVLVFLVCGPTDGATC
nr:reverse transcriptase domain-containing protein [Tanacetum cinerariifolium]